VLSQHDGEKFNLYRIPSDLTGEAERLTTSEFNQYPSDVSPDGRILLFTQRTPGQENDVNILRLDDQGRVEGDPETVAASPTWDYGGRFSPDGKWISYTSAQSGKGEVYVKATPGSGAAVQVSTEGGTNARWSPIENTLFFSKSGKPYEVYSVSFSTEGDVFRPELPEQIFKLEETNLDPRYFEVSPDGKRFLMTTARVNAAWDVWTNPKIIVNWFEELKERVPIE
jgi:Tol biopolymer transport system component